MRALTWVDSNTVYVNIQISIVDVFEIVESTLYLAAQWFGAVIGAWNRACFGGGSVVLYL